MRWKISRAVFVLIRLLLLPATLAGWIAFRLGRGSNLRQEASRTAYGVLFIRWLMHASRGREDRAAGQLLRALAGVPPGSLAAMMGPSIIASRLTGFYPSLYRYPPERPMKSLSSLVGLRTAFLDQALEESLGVLQQVVILGAGFDTRAYGMLRIHRVQVFEIDDPQTQAVKRSALERARIGAAHVRFVAADFNRQAWIERLETVGFDRSKPTFVLWEGVSYYMEPDSVCKTLAEFLTLAGGSAIAFDYASAELVNGRYPFETLSGRIQKRLRLADEPWTFGISTIPEARPHIETFLAANGLNLVAWEPWGRDEPDAPALGGLVVATAGREVDDR